jgi:hypothetical protein
MSANETRLAAAVLLSVAAHLLLIGAVLTWLGRPPVYPETADERGWIVRLVPPPPSVTRRSATSTSRSTSRVLARPWRQNDTAEPVASTPDAAGAKVGAPAGAGAADGEATPERVRQALRSGAVGCANADAVGLNREERTHCDDVLGDDMAQIQRAMRDAEQSRLSTGGRPPSDFTTFMAACRAARQGAGQQRPGRRDGLC